MTSAELSRYAGWSAFASAIATILGLVTLIMFFTLGQPWGTINDLTSILLALSILPVLLVLHRLHRRDAPILSLATFVLGLLAMLVAAAFQTLLVFRVFAYEQTALVVPGAFAVFGATLMVYNTLARASGSLSRKLAWLGMIAGAGYVLVIAGLILGGQQSPITAAGGLIAVVCYPIWAIWFGRLLLLRKINIESP
jgi:MFS family permease